MQENISREFLSLPNTSLEDKKRRVQVIAQQMSNFRNYVTSQIDLNETFVANIKHSLAHPVPKAII